MDLTITFRHSEPSAALRQKIEARVGKLNKYLMKATQAHVILKVEKARHIAEITLLENHHTLFAEAASHDMYASFEEALTKMEHQVKKLKEKVKSHHTVTGQKFPY